MTAEEKALRNSGRRKLCCYFLISRKEWTIYDKKIFRDGFVCWFDRIFSPDTIDRCFIIKGGSGTGKSTFMKRLAAEGEKRGYEAEYYYCSSDPTSLDGLILTRKTMGGEGLRTAAVIDGTAPHTRDPILPGAAEEIINLGDFWDEGMLEKRRGELSALMKEKSALFSEAFEYLFAAGEITRMLRSDAARFMLPEKMRAAAARLIDQASACVPKGERETKKAPRERGKITIRPVSAISTIGEYSFGSYMERDGQKCIVTDRDGTSAMYFDALIEAAVSRGYDVVRAPVPLLTDESEAVHIPDISLTVVSDKLIERAETTSGGEGKGAARRLYDSDQSVRLINMARFMNQEKITKEDRRRRKSLAKCAAELTSNALAGLSQARRVHAAVEAIYISAMNFDRVEEARERVAAKIFGDG